MRIAVQEVLFFTLSCIRFVAYNERQAISKGEELWKNTGTSLMVVTKPQCAFEV